MDLLIAPSLLSADFAHLARDARALAEAGADWLHCDIMDGHFVPNLTFGPLVVTALRGETDCFFDVHLMVERPDFYLRPFAEAGANAITIHLEATTAPHRVLHRIRDLGLVAGLSLCPATPLTSLEYLLPSLDLILIMSVDPGFGGQAFIPSALDRIRHVRRLIDDSGLAVRLAVDGGIKSDNVREVTQAGADTLIVGSWIFDHPEGFRAALADLRTAAS